MSRRPEIGNAAALAVAGIDPVGEAYLRTPSVLIREVWVAVGMRAARDQKAQA
jgi:hypothetical protein